LIWRGNLKKLLDTPPYEKLFIVYIVVYLFI